MRFYSEKDVITFLAGFDNIGYRTPLLDISAEFKKRNRTEQINTYASEFFITDTHYILAFYDKGHRPGYMDNPFFYIEGKKYGKNKT